MGLIKKPTIPHYWRTTTSQSIPWFRRMFSRNRFQLILKFLHLTDNNKTPRRNQEGYNPAAKFQELLDHFNMRAKYLYTPNRQLSIDETLIPSKGRTLMLQYIPSKKVKFGIKLWMLVEATTGYILHCIPYRGRLYDRAPAGQSLGGSVVLNLLRKANLLNKYYHVYCDSFCTSLKLGTELLGLNTYLTGTLRRDRPMPQRIKDNNILPNECVYMRKRDLLAFVYKDNDKKPVRLLSTFHAAKQSHTGKPKCIVKYNKYMGRVDLNDMLTGFYADNRKSVKVWKKVIFNMFQRFMINAYVLYTKNSSDRPLKTRLQFTESVIEALANEYRTIPGQQRRNRLERVLNGRRKDCSVCARQGVVEGQRRRSVYQCTTCGRGVHVRCLQQHLANCREA